MTVDAELRRLYRERPRRRFVRWSSVVLLGLVIFAWTSSELRSAELFSARRLANLERFLGELRPHPLRHRELDAGAVASWAGGLLASPKGLEAARTTLALSVASIVLAALAAWLLALPAARTVAAPEPWLAGPRPPSAARRLGWRAVVGGTRAVLILLRSIPEYVWAFLFLAVLGASAWPVVLALAVHNAGILAKLAAEVIENQPPGPLAALRTLGAHRAQVAAAGLFPEALPRFLLFFFYRWETCVREATVLGMLGVVSLGYWIVDSRARQAQDEMFFLVLLGSAIVLAGDLVSALARRWVRRAGGK